MTDATVPWGTLFGLLFMTMGPLRAVAVFGNLGLDARAPGIRALAVRSAALVAVAYCIAVASGDQTLARWGVGLPALIAATGIILAVLSLQAMMATPSPPPDVFDPRQVMATSIAFPGLFPPVAVALPIIFAAVAPSLTGKMTILGLGMAIIAMNLVAMIHAKSILKLIGRAPLQLLGAVFGVLQTALGIEFVLDAWRML